VGAGAQVLDKAVVQTHAVVAPGAVVTPGKVVKTGQVRRRREGGREEEEVGGGRGSLVSACEEVVMRWGRGSVTPGLITTTTL